MTNHTTPEYWQDACAALSAADPVMATIIQRYEGETLVSRGDPFHSLVRSIIGQQVSVAAAASITRKLEAALHPVTPDHLLSADDDTLRGCGLSRQKITYLRHISEHTLQGYLELPVLQAMTDEDAIRHLTAIKGIGRWTAEMFLIFCLLRPDVYPVDDIGLQKAVRKHYCFKRHSQPGGLGIHKPQTDDAWIPTIASLGEDDKTLTKTVLLTIGNRWQPWRTVATWYLWRSLDPEPVAY